MTSSDLSLARSTLMSLEFPSDGELQQVDNVSGRTTAVILPAATSAEAPCTPVDDLESVSGVSPVLVRSATRNLDVKVMADITATMASSENVAVTGRGPKVSSQQAKRPKLVESDKMETRKKVEMALRMRQRILECFRLMHFEKFQQLVRYIEQMRMPRCVLMKTGIGYLVSKPKEAQALWLS